MKNELFNNQPVNDNVHAPVIEFKSMARSLEESSGETQNEAQIIKFRSILKQTNDYNPRPPEAT